MKIDFCVQRHTIRRLIYTEARMRIAEVDPNSKHAQLEKQRQISDLDEEINIASVTKIRDEIITRFS